MKKVTYAPHSESRCVSARSVKILFRVGVLFLESVESIKTVGCVQGGLLVLHERAGRWK